MLKDNASGSVFYFQYFEMEWKKIFSRILKYSSFYLEVSNINKFEVAGNLYLCVVHVQDREMINVMFEEVQVT